LQLNQGSNAEIAPPTFQSMTVIKVTFVFEEITKQAIFDGETKLTFPHTNCLQVGGVGDKSVIRATRQELGNVEVILNQIPIVNEGLGVFELAQLEGFNRACRRGRRCRSRNHWRGNHDTLMHDVKDTTIHPHQRGRLGSHRGNDPGLSRCGGQVWGNSLARNRK
jgi:hypothetical protein